MENQELKDRIKFKIAMSEINNEGKNNMRKSSGIIKGLAVAACFIFLIGGVTFADELSEKIYDIYNFRKQYNIQTKLPEEIVNDEEKLQEVMSNINAIIPWEPNAADIVESENTTVEISSVGMDDYYMVFEGSINLADEVLEKMPIEDIYVIRIPDLVIRDENDNILFCMEENKLKELFKTDDIEAIKNNSKYCISEAKIYSFKNYDELGNNPFNFEYYINTALPGRYPKSKKLYFEFTKLALDAPEAHMGRKPYLNQDQTLTVSGNWNIEFDVEPKYYEREELITYKLTKSDSNPKNQLLYCFYKDGVMHTSFRLESEERNNGPWGSVKLGDMFAELDVDKDIKDYMMYKICSSDEYKAREKWVEEVRFTKYHYIENSNGVRSKPMGLCKFEDGIMKSASKTSSRVGGVIIDGIFQSSEIPGYMDRVFTSPGGTVFDIAEKDLTDKMTIKIGYLGKDITFEIERVEGR